ncbi:MAG: hypothetical protein M3518_03065 [Actinomycetota bacterium]|nr:hypothetical protein [Actinomycetota bacterium]
MNGREFRLPGSPYEELVNIIVAYGTRDEASRPGDVRKLDSVHQSSVSRNNAFLAAIGVLKGEREKLVTRQGRTLALALMRQDEAEIRRNWRVIVSSSDFLQNVVSAVKLREGMSYETVQAYVAHSAGQPRNKPVMTGSGAIIEILKVANLLKEEAGEMIPTFDEDFEKNSSSEVSDPLDATGEPIIETSADTSITTSIETEDGPRVNIHLHIQCTADEIEDLAPRLKALMRELSRE